MSLRQTINEKQRYFIPVIVLVIIIAVGVSWLLSFGRDSLPSKAYYTTDDGKTVFTDSSNLAAPFLKDGETAVKVVMMSCDGGKTILPAYLERFTPAAQKQISEAGMPLSQMPPNMASGISSRGGKEVKKANDLKAKWVSLANLGEAIGVMTFKCPSGVRPEIALP